MFPNPVNAELSIRGLNANDDVVILNASGTELRRAKAIGGQEMISMDHFTKGIYINQIIRGGLYYSKRVVKGQ
ncbi:Por secretion system C-terminal sorting domain-containing protein [Dyadobacter sp. SG02]|uniref:T9SS type A sorting domain-containing protein n=1 Tax=Dyadobacter sp. SG02 TaxID=1855291 RepID=UPI0008C2F1FF|nr:Por secretion system C-terminal sorting domain-containing protein [Dyadobacter sp. SG02]